MLTCSRQAGMLALEVLHSSFALFPLHALQYLGQVRCSTTAALASAVRGRRAGMQLPLLALAVALLAGSASAGLGDDIRSSFSDLGSEIATIADVAANGTIQALQTTSAPLC